MKLEFDPSHKLSYCSYRCPECGIEFYGGGEAIHRKGCSQTDYANCVCVIGPNVVARVKVWAELHGDECHDSLNPLSLKDIRDQLPQVL